MAAYTVQLEQLQKENETLREEVSHLKEQLEWLRRQVFGQRSEKILPNQSEQLVFDSFEDSPLTQEERRTIKEHQRLKQKREGQNKITLPENLPVERQVLDVPEEEKANLIKIGEEVSRKLAFKPGNYFIKEIVRPKYALPENSGIHTAALPESLLTRCLADESFLADIITKKFADHLPLYRQSEMLARERIFISRQVLSQWVNRCGQALKPLYNALQFHILQTGNIYIDETPVNMLDPGNGKTHQAYMWTIVGGKEKDPPNRIYHFRTGRGYSNAEDLLKGYRGILHSDKFGAYEKLANIKQFIWCPCYSHIRRKFFEAETGDPPFQQWVLRKIKYLFMLERVAWARSDQERLRIRQEKESPIIDELITAIKDKLVHGKILPKSKLREALGYFCGLIPYLKNYTQHAHAHLDNNAAERAVRPLAIGRKNWLFVGNEVGGETAAILLSLIQSCRAQQINPREYLEDVMRRLMLHNAQKLSELLPGQWQKYPE